MKTEKNAMGNQDAELWQHESTSVATCREGSVQREQSQESPRAIGRCGSRPITAYGRGGKFGGLKVLVACGDRGTGPAVRSPSGARGDVCPSTHNRYATGEVLAPTGTQTTSR